MWKLLIEDDQANKTEVNLVRDEYSLGRAEENTVRLTERNISRRHARMRKNGAGWVLEDLTSYNGCYVNGVRVGEHCALHHGDLVQFGDYRLEVTDDVTAKQSTLSNNKATVPALPKSHALLGQPDRLVVLVGPVPGAEYPLSGDHLTVGRGEECTISINHASVSRVHAEIQPLGDGRYEIIDRESANGVRVNGAELHRAILDARDNVELGDVVLKFIPEGQVYRPGSDESQQIGALELATARDNATLLPQNATHVPKSVKIVAFAGGAVLLLLLIGVTLRSGSKVGAGTTSVDRASQVLIEAQSLAEQGDVESAHAKVAELPTESNARKSPGFRKIEADWADLLLKRARETTDPDQKRELLDRVARTASVDSTRRRRAAQELQEQGRETVDISELPASRPRVSTGAHPANRPNAAGQGSVDASAKAPKGPVAPTNTTLVRSNPFDEAPAPERPRPR